jgi:hypothetical protein
MNNAPLVDDGRQVGRPKSQKQIVAQNFRAILEDVAKGNALLQTLEKRGVHWNAFYAVIQSSPKRREAYARARESCVEQWIDQIVPMTDKVIGQEMAIVTATRNAVDVRKWVASRLMPNQYGDQPTGVTINNQSNVMVLSDDKLRTLQETRRRMMLDAQGTGEV